MMTPGTSSMLRARRRDVNVKPNRRLDRKSSRGMLYENEELRLRTININAEVERGQNDIKKLRRENEQLRREIWGLREEYDRLEGLLGKAKRRGQLGNTSQDEDTDNGEGCEDEDAEYDEEEEDDDDDASPCEHSADLDNAENQQIASSSSGRTPGQSRRNSLRVEFDGLSIVDEETETVSNDVTPAEQAADEGACALLAAHKPKDSRQDAIIFGVVKPQDSESCTVISKHNQVDSAYFNNPNATLRHEQQFFGKIKLPNGKEGVFMSDAVLPNHNISNGLPIYVGNSLKGNSYDFGSVVGFNQNDHHILNENVWPEIPTPFAGASQNVIHRGSTMFPPSQSHYNLTFTPVDSTLLPNGASTQDNYAFERPNNFSGIPDADGLLPKIAACSETRSENAYLEGGGNTALHECDVNDDMYFGMGENMAAAATATTGDDVTPDYYHRRGGPDLFISGAYPITRSPGAFPVGGNLDQLLRQMSNKEGENVRRVFAVPEPTFVTDVGQSESDAKKVPRRDDAENVRELVDPLETRTGSKLNDTVPGVHMVNSNGYECLVKEDNAGALLETGVKINLEDVSRHSVTVALSGVPLEVPDSTVVRGMASYGYVIGAVERRLYKGVDTGERLVRMQPADADVKNIPSSINLAGSKVGLRILKPDEVKRLGSECVPESPGVTGAKEDDKTSNVSKTPTKNGDNTTKSLDSSFSTDRYRSQLNVRLKQPNLKTIRSMDNIFDSATDRMQHNTSLPIIGTCDTTSETEGPLRMSSETILSETQNKKPSRERLLNAESLEHALSPIFTYPHQSDTVCTLSTPGHEASPKQTATGEGREKSKELELAQPIQENKILKAHPQKEPQSSPEIAINHTPNIFSKLPNRKSKCQNAQFISTTDESTDSIDLHLKSSPQLQNNPFVGNFRTISPNNAPLSIHPRRPMAPAQVNPFISSTLFPDNAVIHQDIIPHGEQSVQCHNSPQLPNYQCPSILSPDLTALTSSDHQQFFLPQGKSNSKATIPCEPYSHSIQTSDPAFISNEAIYIPNLPAAPFPGTPPSSSTTIAYFSPSQPVASSGTNASSSLPQNNNLQPNSRYFPNCPIPSSVALVPPPDATVPGSAGYLSFNGTNIAAPSTTYVPGNVTLVVPPSASIPGNAEYFPVTSDLPTNTHPGNSSTAQSTNLSVPNTSCPNTSTFSPSQENSSSSQMSVGPHPQHLVNELNIPRQGHTDVAEDMLEVPRAQSPSLPSSPVPIQKQNTQTKASRKSITLSHQHSKSSGDEGPNLSPPTAHKHLNVNPLPKSPGTARRKGSRKISCTNSIVSHHNVDNSINETSAAAMGGPNATSSPNTKHRTSAVHHRKTSAGAAGSADASEGGHANAIDVSRSSSSGQDSPTKPDRRRRVSIYFNNKKGAGKRRDSSFLPNGGSVPSGGILTRSLSLEHTNRYVGGSTTDVTTTHCVGAETTTTTCSERERTNSGSSRTSSAAGGLGTGRLRKQSVCSTRGGSGSDVGKVPWCGCWGNGCI